MAKNNICKYIYVHYCTTFSVLARRYYKSVVIDVRLICNIGVVACSLNSNINYGNIYFNFIGFVVEFRVEQRYFPVAILLDKYKFWHSRTQ